MAQLYQRKSTRSQKFPMFEDPKWCTATHWLHCSLYFSWLKARSKITRSNKRRFPTHYPDKEVIANEAIWPQWIPESQRFVYHLIAKVCCFQKPTYKTVRLSLKAMENHAESNNVLRISMPQIGCGLDKLDWSKVHWFKKFSGLPT